MKLKDLKIGLYSDPYSEIIIGEKRFPKGGDGLLSKPIVPV